MAGRVGALRASLGFVLLVSFMWFLFVGSQMINCDTRMATTLIPSTADSEVLKLIGTKRHAVQWGPDLNYVSKRRVPNGPDPIHNRE